MTIVSTANRKLERKSALTLNRNDSVEWPGGSPLLNAHLWTAQIQSGRHSKSNSVDQATLQPEEREKIFNLALPLVI